jgi:hypothetical protein
MNADGSDQIRLTNNSANDYTSAWSPDGTEIAFSSDRDGNYEIYVMNADGSDQIRLTNNSANDRFPAWSPDGTEIAFSSDRDGDFEIYVMNADGSDQIRLTNNSANDDYPAWSPDGTKITFSSDRDGNHEIYVMNADGSDQIRLTNNPTLDWFPAWCCGIPLDPCKNISCPNSECNGFDLWAIKCRNGECLRDHIIEENSEKCGYYQQKPSMSSSNFITIEVLVYLIVGGILGAITIGVLVIFVSRRKRLSTGENEEKSRISRKRSDNLRMKLDEDYIENRISRDEYLRRKSELEEM